MKTRTMLPGLALLAASALAGLSFQAVAAPVLYGVTGSGGTSSSLYTIDPLSGATALVGATGFSHVTGIDFDPLTGTLYGVVSDLRDSGTAELITIDRTTGAGTLVGSTGHQIPDITIGPDGVLRGWSEFDSGSTTFDDPVVIDKGTGAVLLTSSTRSTGRTGVAWLDATHLFVKSSSNFYSVDVTTGASSFLFSTVSADNLLENTPGGNLITGARTGGGTRWYGFDTGTTVTTTLAFSTVEFSAIAYSEDVSVPEPVSLALLGSGLVVVGFARRRRQAA